MTLLVVGLVVIVLVILVVVFLSVRSSRGSDEDDYPIRPAGRDTRGADADGPRRRAGQPASGGTRPGAGRSPARSRAPQGWDDDHRSGFGQQPGYDDLEPAADDYQTTGSYPAGPAGPAGGHQGAGDYEAADDYEQADAYQDRGADRGADRGLRDRLPGQGRRSQVPAPRSADDESGRRFPALARQRGNARDHDQVNGADAPAIYETAQMSRSSAARDLRGAQNGRSRSSASAQDADSGRFRRGGRNKAGLDWQDTDWGKVSDEQYWAELSSDKPLATTARSAQSAASLAAATRDRPAEAAEHDPAGRGPAQGLGQLARRRRPVRGHPGDDAVEPAAASAAQGPDTDPGTDGPARWPDASDPSLPTSSWAATSRSDTGWPSPASPGPATAAWTPPRESADGWTPAEPSEAAWTAPEDAPAAWTPREEPAPAWASEEPSAAPWTAPESSGDRWTPSEEPAAWTPPDETSATWTPSDEASATWAPSDDTSTWTPSDASGSGWTPSDAPAPGGWTPSDAAAWPAHEPAAASWPAEDPLTSPSYATQSAQAADSRSYGKSHRQAQPADSDPSGGYDYPSDPAWNGNGADHNGANHNGASHEAYSGGWSPAGDDYGSLDPLPEHGSAAPHGAAENSPGPAENWYQAPVSSDAPEPYPASRNGSSQQPGFGYQDAPAYPASQPRHGNGYSDPGHQGWAGDSQDHNGYSHSNGYSPGGYDAGQREDSYHRADPGYPAEPAAYPAEPAAYPAEPAAYPDYSAGPGYPAGHDYAADQAHQASPAHQAYPAESGYEHGPAGYGQPDDYQASRPPYDHGAGYEPYPGYEGDRR